MLAAQKYVENVYYHELARALRGFGYNVVNSARGDFEIAEVSAAVRERFSSSSQQCVGKTDRFDVGYAPPNPAPLAAAGVRGELLQGRFAPRTRKWKRAGQSTWIALASPFREHNADKHTETGAAAQGILLSLGALGGV
jgi:hypothetical protein